MKAEERSYKYRKIAVTSDDGVVDAVYNLSALADQAIALLRRVHERNRGDGIRPTSSKLDDEIWNFLENEGYK